MSREWTLKTLHKVKSQTQKATRTWVRLYEIFRIGKSIETESKLVVASKCCWGNEKWLLIDVEFLWGDENVLKLDSSDGSTTWEYTKNQQIVQVKSVILLVCEWYLNFKTNQNSSVTNYFYTFYYLLLALYLLYLFDGNTKGVLLCIF